MILQMDNVVRLQTSVMSFKNLDCQPNHFIMRM